MFLDRMNFIRMRFSIRTPLSSGHTVHFTYSSRRIKGKHYTELPLNLSSVNPGAVIPGKSAFFTAVSLFTNFARLGSSPQQ